MCTWRDSRWRLGGWELVGGHRAQTLGSDVRSFRVVVNEESEEVYLSHWEIQPCSAGE